MYFTFMCSFVSRYHQNPNLNYSLECIISAKAKYTGKYFNIWLRKGRSGNLMQGFPKLMTGTFDRYSYLKLVSFVHPE